jgi:fluoroquinolone transport system ATP-binding protein
MIRVKNLNYSYPKSEQLALKNLNFEIAAGEIVGFLGPSGAGKSTTQKVLIRLLQGYQGNIEVMGRSLNSWNEDYYEQIGVGFELPNHYLKLTGLENLTYFSQLYTGPTDDPLTLLKRVGLDQAKDMPVSQYSKGMKMRLNFIRALIHRPQLLFLDEPTSGLDPTNARLILDLIREYRDQGMTIFLTTHNMQVADELCDRVAFVVEGEIRLLDSPRTLKLRYGQRLVKLEINPVEGLKSYQFPLEGLADNPEFLTLLRNPALQTLHTQETSLEDIFLQVTGRHLT